MNDKNNPFSVIEKNLGHVFKNKAYLQRALTHKSSVMRAADANERMEFLGDALLSSVVADYVYAHYPAYDEGALTRIRAYFVCRTYLTDIAKRLSLPEFIQMEETQAEKGTVKVRASIQSNTVEAVIAAIYLDAGFEAMRACVLAWYGNDLDSVEGLSSDAKDHKTQLQEYCQKHKIALPMYTVLTVTGVAHKQTFHVRCDLALDAEAMTSDDQQLTLSAEGKGSSKRNAQQQAAKAVLLKLDTQDKEA